MSILRQIALIKEARRALRDLPQTSRANPAKWHSNHNIKNRGAKDEAELSMSHCNALRRTATHYPSLQHTATHCTTPHHTAPHCTTLHHNFEAEDLKTNQRVSIFPDALHGSNVERQGLSAASASAFRFTLTLYRCNLLYLYTQSTPCHVPVVVCRNAENN